MPGPEELYMDGELQAAPPVVMSIHPEIDGVSAAELLLQSVSGRAFILYVETVHHFADRHAAADHDAADGFDVLDPEDPDSGPDKTLVVDTGTITPEYVGFIGSLPLELLKAHLIEQAPIPPDELA